MHRAAQTDGRVYAMVPLKMYNTTEPLIDRLNQRVEQQALLVDTGSSGLVIDEPNAGDLSNATPIVVLRRLVQRWVRLHLRHLQDDVGRLRQWGRDGTDLRQCRHRGSGHRGV